VTEKRKRRARRAVLWAAAGIAVAWAAALAWRVTVRLREAGELTDDWEREPE